MTSAATLATQAAPWSIAAPWGGQGYLTDLDGPVHWVRFGSAESSAPPLVFVHGLGGSHLNWALIATELAVDRRAYAIDLGGFGLTLGAGRDTGVRANRALLDRFLREIIGGPVILVGNSMGGMISILEAAAQPELVAGTVLLDPALPAPIQRPDVQVAAQFALYAVPVVGERYLRWAQGRLSPEQQVQRVINVCFADPSRYDRQLFAAGVALVEQRRSFDRNEASFLRAARTLLAIQARPAPYRRAIGTIGGPVLLIHGERDRLVPIAAARQVAAARPSWDTRFLPDVGHTPQLEAPAEVAGAIRAWLGRYPELDAPAEPAAEA